MKLTKYLLGAIALSITMFGCKPSAQPLKIVQLTNGAYNHDLDNNDNFSPDGKWLVYDTRTATGGIGGSPSVERVNVESGKVEEFFTIKGNQSWGPGAGAVSYHPTENRVIFIHGLAFCSEKNPYQQWKRTGTIVDDNHPNVPIFMDARDVTFPYTPGALRGGTHRHEWSKDGKWVGYTYNDAIMKAIEDSTGEKINLRTVGVSTKIKPVIVDHSGEGENLSGEWYSVLVVRVVPHPIPGSDEISNAASDSWVGTGSYLKQDGTRQVARAFIGKVRSKNNLPVDELFVVDIPDSINQPGEFGPLEGTPTTFPMPPKGTVQRRLTFTAETAHPGCGGVVRSSSDGKWIAYLASDANGKQQIFIVSPDGGSSRQLTAHPAGVQSCARWNPDNLSICYQSENSIVICKISDEPFEKRFHRITPVTKEELSNIVWSPDGKTIAFNRPVKAEGAKDAWKQIFVVKLK
jgi:WD40 repeat protein